MGFLEELLRRSGAGDSGDSGEVPGWVRTTNHETPLNPAMGNTPQSPDLGGDSPIVNQGISSNNPASPDMGGDSPLTSFNQNASVPPQKTSRIKSMLTNFALGMGEGMMHSAGVETPQQAQTRQATNAHTAALTQLTQQQVEASKAGMQMIDTPLGQMPQNTWKALAPAFVRGQAQRDVQGLKNEGGLDVQGLKNEGALDNIAAKGPAGATGKIDPVIYAQIGASPDPKTDPKGAKMWGLAAEAIKTRMATAPRVAGANALAQGRAANTPFSTVDENGNPTTISNLQAIKQGATGINKQNLGTTMGKAALIGDIKGGVEQVRQYSKVFDNPVSRKQLAAVLAAPGVTAQTFLQQPIAASMDDDTAQAAISLLNLKENAMAMRSVLGAGQGSEDLRKAIQQTIPNGLTPNSKYAGHQLDTFLGTLGRLERGIPNLGAATSNALGNGVVKWEKGPDGKPHKVTQ